MCCFLSDCHMGRANSEFRTCGTTCRQLLETGASLPTTNLWLINEDQWSIWLIKLTNVELRNSNWCLHSHAMSRWWGAYAWQYWRFLRATGEGTASKILELQDGSCQLAKLVASEHRRSSQSPTEVLVANCGKRLRGEPRQTTCHRKVTVTYRNLTRHFDSTMEGTYHQHSWKMRLSV